jgi:flagellar motor switch protein FliG
MNNKGVFMGHLFLLLLTSNLKERYLHEVLNGGKVSPELWAQIVQHLEQSFRIIDKSTFLEELLENSDKVERETVLGILKSENPEAHSKYSKKIFSIEELSSISDKNIVIQALGLFKMDVLLKASLGVSPETKKILLELSEKSNSDAERIESTSISMSEITEIHKMIVKKVNELLC